MTISINNSINFGQTKHSTNQLKQTSSSEQTLASVLVSVLIETLAAPLLALASQYVSASGALATYLATSTRHRDRAVTTFCTCRRLLVAVFLFVDAKLKFSFTVTLT